MKVAWNMVLKRKSKDALPWKAHFASMVLPAITCLLSGKVWWVEEGNRSYCKILKGAEFSICFTVYFFFFIPVQQKLLFHGSLRSACSRWKEVECIWESSQVLMAFSCWWYEQLNLLKRQCCFPLTPISYPILSECIVLDHLPKPVCFIKFF